MKKSPLCRNTEGTFFMFQALPTLFGVAAFVPLLVRLWQIQIRDYDKYQGMAVEQQTADSTISHAPT